MADPLRDQLLKSGLGRNAKPGPRKPPPREAKADRKAQGDSDGIDLARAWSLRQRADSQEQQRRTREAEAEARARKARRRALQALLNGAALQSEAAELVRHFDYRGKIRRVHVDSAQLRALNAGELGIVQLGGRYLLVHADIARQATVIDPDAVALLVEPGAANDDDGVPDGLIW